MKNFLIISQLIYLLCMVPWLVVWGLSFMGFDNGVSLVNVSIVLAIGVYPIAVIICSIIAWLLRSRRKRTAIIVNLVPCLWVIGLGIPLLILNLS
ncbi:MAG: hypothetical protein K0S39_5534 [Paenibacillus sp.]|jgi:hypothetical protein|nr:hypothetical protein [Paenibacillus sp.]